MAPKKAKATKSTKWFKRSDWQRCFAELEMDRIEAQLDLDGAMTRLAYANRQLGSIRREHADEVKRLKAIIAKQREWIATLNRRLDERSEKA